MFCKHFYYVSVIFLVPHSKKKSFFKVSQYCLLIRCKTVMLFTLIQWCFLGWWWVIHVFGVMWCGMLNGFSTVQSREESSGSCWQDATVDKIQLFLQLLRLSLIKKKREFISVSTRAYTWLGVDWKQIHVAQTVAVVFSVEFRILSNRDFITSCFFLMGCKCL